MKLIQLYFLVFTMMSASTSAKSLYVSAKLVNKTQIEFNVKNNSNSDVTVDRSFIINNEISLIISNHLGVIVESDKWRMQDHGLDEVFLKPAHGFKLEIELKSLFTNIQSKLDEECLFLFWGFITPFRSDGLYKEANAGAVILNNLLCNANDDREQVLMDEIKIQ